jgi:hypothetical protein
MTCPVIDASEPPAVGRIHFFFLRSCLLYCSAHAALGLLCAGQRGLCNHARR